MGTKFGNFSILGSNIKEASELLVFIPKRRNILEIMDKINPENGRKFSTIVQEMVQGDPQYKKAFEYMSSSKSDYYLGTNHKWTTIYSEEFGWGSTENHSMEISKHYPNFVFSASLFDEDVFQFNILKNGVILSEHISGDAEINDAKKSLGDIKVICQVFNIIGQENKLENILNYDDLAKKIEDLEIILGVDIWINDIKDLKTKGWKKVTIQ
jgi:hypothetical protein